MRTAARRATVVLLAGGLCVATGGPTKKKPPAEKPPPPELPAYAELPSNPNLAVLRLTAAQSLYELDASPEQMHAVRAAAESAGVADAADRAAAGKPPEAVVKAAAALRDALLEAEPDDTKVAVARNALADAVADVEPPLNDAVHPSAAARVKAAAIAKTFTAGQLAAYVAAHADQVVGPAERLAAAQADVHEASDEEVADVVKRLSDDVAVLAVGATADPARLAAVTAKAADWLRANRAADDDVPEARAKLEASAKAAVGDVPLAEVIGHWFDEEVAELVANPQASAAVVALTAARARAAEKDH